MVTLPLERMASRVAASLCFATGLGHEMVVNSQQVSVICIKLHLCGLTIDCIHADANCIHAYATLHLCTHCVHAAAHAAV